MTTDACDGLLTTFIVEATETESKQESNEPNAFDKVQADENDAGKTGANVNTEQANGDSEETNGHAEDTEQTGKSKTEDAIVEEQTREEAHQPRGP